jgi:hypothetical protein
MFPRPALAALLLAAACATPETALRDGQSPVPLVRQAIDAGLADAVFARAVAVLTRRGYDFVTCDLSRGAVRTERGEQDVPCMAVSCLSRQVVTVKLGWRSVRLAVVREVYDGALRAWVPARDPAAMSAVEREEAQILGDLLAADLEGARPAEAGEPAGPCAQAARCGPDQCSGMLHLAAK